MDMGFAVTCPLARHRRPPIRFLFIGSHLCSALLSGPTSRRVLFHPCASLSLHVHHVVKRTCTAKLSIMRGTPKTKRPGGRVRRDASYCGIEAVQGLEETLGSAPSNRPTTEIFELLRLSILSRA